MSLKSCNCPQTTTHKIVEASLTTRALPIRFSHSGSVPLTHYRSVNSPTDDDDNVCSCNSEQSRDCASSNKSAGKVGTKRKVTEEKDS